MNRPFLSKFSEIIDKSQLNENTKNIYKSRLKRLTEITNKDVDFIIDHSKHVVKILDQEKIKYATQIAFVSTIMTLFKYTKNLLETKRESYNSWCKIYDSLTNENNKNKTVKVSEWNSIIKIRDSLDKNSNEFFILALYTYLEPNIGDLYKIKLYNQLPNDINNNYWLMDEKKSIICGKKKKQEVPNILDNIVRNNLKSNPRRYLILNQKGKPYVNTHSYNVYIDRILKKLFGKQFCLNILRTSYKKKKIKVQTISHSY